jgi:hypothetical protein
MPRAALNLTMALLVALGGACAKSANKETHQRGNRPPRKTSEQRFAEFDTNKDGKLSLQEFRGKATQAEHIAILDNDFRAADTNHDGFLSLDEYKAYLEKIRSNSRGGWGGGGRMGGSP